MRAQQTAEFKIGTIRTPEAEAASDRPTFHIQGYTLEHQLGSGGQATVYLAVQQNTGRKVAIKIIRAEALADERALARFKREVQVLAALDDPNIVGILDKGVTSDGRQFIAMNYVAGATLDQYLGPRKRADSPDPIRLLRLFLKICAAVNVAHVRGIVHRDLKPGNIRIDERGEPHILDFGLAYTPLDRLAGGEHPVAVTGEFLGSLPWCSPEQAEGDPDRIDMRTDVYSLGVILYQMLTDGNFPYQVVGNIRDVLNNILSVEPTPPSKLTVRDQPPGKLGAPPVNETIERIVLKALNKNRELRYQNAGELGRELSHYLAGQQTSAPPAVPANESFHSSRTLLIAAAMVLCAAGTVIWIITRKSGPRQSDAPSMISGAAATTSPAPPPEALPTFAPAIASTITVANGTCHLEGDALALTPNQTGSVVYFGPITWSNYDASFDAMTNADTGPVGYRVTMHQLARSSYQFWIGDDGNAMTNLSVRIAGATEIVSRQPFRVEPDRWYHVKIVVRESDIKCFIDGQLCCSVKDTRFTHGRLGLITVNPNARFRNILVTAPDGKIMWQGPPDLSALPSSQIDPPASIHPPEVKKTDLLKNVDVSSDVLNGSWNIVNGEVVGQGPRAQIQFRSPLPEEYDFRISFIRSSGDGPIAMMCTKQGNTFAWVVGGEKNTVSGFELFNDRPYDNNESTRKAAKWISNGYIHTLVVRVRKDAILAYLDGRTEDQVRGAMFTVSLPQEMKPLKNASLGVWLGEDTVTVKSASLFEVMPRAAVTTSATEPAR